MILKLSLRLIMFKNKDIFFFSKKIINDRNADDLYRKAIESTIKKLQDELKIEIEKRQQPIQQDIQDRDERIRQLNERIQRCNLILEQLPKPENKGVISQTDTVKNGQEKSITLEQAIRKKKLKPLQLRDKTGETNLAAIDNVDDDPKKFAVNKTILASVVLKKSAPTRDVNSSNENTIDPELEAKLNRRKEMSEENGNVKNDVKPESEPSVISVPTELNQAKNQKNPINTENDTQTVEQAVNSDSAPFQVKQTSTTSGVEVPDELANILAKQKEMSEGNGNVNNEENLSVNEDTNNNKVLSMILEETDSQHSDNDDIQQKELRELKEFEKAEENIILEELDELLKNIKEFIGESKESIEESENKQKLQTPLSLQFKPRNICESVIVETTPKPNL